MSDSYRNAARPGLELALVPHPNDPPKAGSPPHRYTREIHDKIVLGIRSGFTPEHVSASCGISATTFREWIRKGVDGDPWLEQFAADVESARSYALMFREQILNEGLRPDADAPLKDRIAQGEFALKVLERSDTKHWAKTVQHLIQKNTDQLLGVLERGLTPREFERVLKLLSSTSEVVPPQDEQPE